MSRCDILMYHMVSNPETMEDRRFAIPPHRLEQHVSTLRRNGHSFVSLDRVADWLDGKADLPERAVAVTLDDGYEDNYWNAFPIFAEQQIPATIFLVSGLMGKSNRWMEGRGFSSRKLMTWDQAREIDRHGITLGAHTVNHARLSQLSGSAAADEIVSSKRQIEQHLGHVVEHFAYPYGDLNEASERLVEEAGFRTACSTRPGPNRKGTSRFVLRRIEVFGTDSTRNVLRKLKFGTNDSSISVPLRYYWSRFMSKL